MTRTKKTKALSSKIVESVKGEYLASATAEPVLQVGLATAAAAFPAASPFVVLLSQLIPSRRIMRVEESLKDCFQKLDSLQVELDQDWIKSEDFSYLFEECVRGFAQNHQREKIEAFKAILIKAAIGSGLKVDEQEYYLGLVHRLTPIHIKLLRVLDEARKIPQGSPGADSHGSVKTILNVDLSIIVAAYADLETLQFTNTSSDGIGSYFTVSLGRMGGRINQAAIKFIEFITLGSEELL